MSARWKARAAAIWRNRRDDRGFTLTELLVSMSVLAVVMVLVTGAVLQASGASARVDAANASQLQAHQAFDKLDRQVRWAAGFSKEGVVGGNSYVEWLYTANGTATCNELRLDATKQQLQQRSWTQGDLRTVSRWQVVASGVGGTTPFTTTPADSSFGLARLRILVTATAGGVKAKDTATHDVTYTALNSTGATVPTTVCTEGRTTA